MWYTLSVKIKTSVTLSEELLAALGSETAAKNRSAFIEEAAWEFLEMRKRRVRDRREFELIEANRESLNSEARDVLDYQDEP